MTNYIKDAIRTESLPTLHLTPHQTRLLHASIGLNTENGEFQDALKKHLFYGRPLDLVNLSEEIGDIFWYLAIACDELGVSFEEVQAKNIDKLRTRYPEKFTEHHATNRQLDEERKVLEGPLQTALAAPKSIVDEIGIPPLP